jgi:hypothetical protein
MRISRLAIGAFALLAMLGGCGPGNSTDAPLPGPTPGVAVPDFSLEDVNPNSATYQTLVSPRDHLGRISAWYFGHST